MHILHTESSSGWGGQEIRILKESEGMRSRGYEVVFAVATGGGLVKEARKAGFTVYELDFKWLLLPALLYRLIKIMIKHDIDLINTHSSLDAWMGGMAARLSGKKIVRTRHLSTPIRKGFNSRMLYKGLADYVVTTSSGIIPMICSQSGLSPFACKCIPTGVDPSELKVDPSESKKFREQLGIKPTDFLVGTACFVRSWKGINDFMSAAKLLQDQKNIKWVIVGGGHLEEYQKRGADLDLGDQLIFTGHMDVPYAAIAAMDLFLLLSTANEGISQSSLQAAYLERPLMTTPIGGLPEVCLPGKTGVHVATFSPKQVAQAVLELKADEEKRKTFGASGRKLVEEKFTLQQTLDQMEVVYKSLSLY